MNLKQPPTRGPDLAQGEISWPTALFRNMFGNASIDRLLGFATDRLSKVLHLAKYGVIVIAECYLQTLKSMNCMRPDILWQRRQLSRICRNSHKIMRKSHY